MCRYFAPERLLCAYLPVCLCASVCHWLCISLALVSLSPSLSGQMAAAKLSSWNSALVSHYLPILVSLLATEKLQGNCRNLAQQSIEGKRSAVVQQSEVHHRFNRLCIIATRLGAQLRLWAKMGAGKVLWVSNNCTSRYSNCSYNQTRKPKHHSESID